MRVNIVNPYQSAAMLRMSHPLKELGKLYEVTESTDVDIDADLNIHMPFHTLALDRDYGKGKHIAVYTHCNPGAETELYLACQRADIVTAMSFQGRKELLNLGVDPKKIWVIYAGSDQFTFRKRSVLVVGYPQPNGRKRESLLLDLAWQYDLDKYEFVLLGMQWEQIASQLASLGVSVKYSNADNHEMIRQFYQVADIFLATGYVEGGPLPLLEAMASGTKVLSPRFGYAADLLNDEDLYSTTDELMEKMDALSEKQIYYHQLARAWRWTDYAAEYALIIGRLLNQSVDLYPERAASRYAQLLDIIDRERPKRLCEIGTWNGNRAIQMIQAASKYHQTKRLHYQGFDLFDSQTGEQFIRELSKYGQPVEVVRRRLEATGVEIKLTEGETFDTLGKMEPADFIFVDGGHSEETIQNDGIYALYCVEYDKATAVFDDYYHEGKPEGMGCNKFIDALNPDKYEVTHLPVRTRAEDGRLIGMVQVKRASISIQVPTVAHYTNFSRN